MSSDLFAGLSLNPTASPDKAKPPTTEGASSTPAVVGSSSSSAAVTPNNGGSHTNGSSTSTGNPPTPTPPPLPPPPSAPPVRLTSAPATDKLLGLLGGVSESSSPPPAVASPPRRVASAGTPVSTTPNAAAAAETAAEVLTAFSMDSQGTTPGAKVLQAAAATSTPTRNDKHSTKPSSPSPSTTTPATATSTSPIKPSLRGVGIVTTPIPNAPVAMRLFQKFAQKTRHHVPASHGGTKQQGILGYLFFSSTQVYDRKFDAYKALMEKVILNEDDNVDADRDDNHDTTTTTTTETRAQEAVARFCHLLNVWGHASAHMAEVESKTSQTYQTFCDILSLGLDTATALVTHGCLDGVCIVEATTTTTTTTAPKGAVDVLAESVFASDLSQERVELAAMKFLLCTGCRVISTTTTLSSSSSSTTTSTQAMLRGTHLLQAIRVLYHVYLTTVSNANKTTARASLQQLVTSVFVRMIAASEQPSSTIGNNNDADDDADDEEDKMVDFPTENHRDAFLVLRSLCKLSMRSPPNNMHSHIGLQAGNSSTTWDATQNNTSTTVNNSSMSPPSTPTAPGTVSSPKSPTRTKLRDSIPPPTSPATSSTGGHSEKTATNTITTATKYPSSQSQSQLQSHHEAPYLIYTQAIHPALESKILALDLLLYVLQTTQMTGDFLQRSGRQFHNAIRNYLCVSLLKNCTSDDTRVVHLSLRVFVPLFQNFRSILKTEIEAFVTNVFFVILDSKNSPMEHKSLVVTLFEEICSNPQTLAEIFLNYDCDLSAVDLFHRIVNTLAKVARSMEMEDPAVALSHSSAAGSTISLVTGVGAARMEKLRSAHRELRLHAMRALRQVLASLHGSIVKPMNNPNLSSLSAHNPNNTTTKNTTTTTTISDDKQSSNGKPSALNGSTAVSSLSSTSAELEKQSLVEIYGSKKKRREEESEVILRFNQKPWAGLTYAAQCGHLDITDPVDVAKYLLSNKDKLDKTQIGEYLGREPDYQSGFAVKVLHGYVNAMDFSGLVFDDAIRFYLSGFRLPGEAQKIDRIMEKFAERFTSQNPDVFPTADVAFILAFSIIMLNTDLHNPAIKEDRRMTKEGFIRNNRGICDGKDLPSEMLTEIFDRIKENPISLKEDDEARERAGGGGGGSSSNSVSTTLPSALSPAAFFTSPYEEADRTKETNFNKERDQIVRTTESLLRRRRHSTADATAARSNRRSRANSITATRQQQQQSVKYVRTEDSGLRDEYVIPMFEVTWGPALAAFATAMESANGTIGSFIYIATDEELEASASNAAETIEVCLTGFRYAICTAGLCGNDVARDAYMLALTRFSQLGTGTLLETRHVRCIQTILALARSDGELLGSSWEHVFKSLSEINRFHQLFQLLARNDRAVAQAAARRRARLEERERRRQEKLERKMAKENSDTLDDASLSSMGMVSEGDLSYGDSDLFSESSDMDFDENMDKKAIDEANARTVYEAVSEALIEAIYERSASMSTPAVKEFVLQLCRVSRMEISHYGGHVGSQANQVDLTKVQYRQHHSLLGNAEGFQQHQPNIYNLQKLVEVTHYNMDSRPRLVFAELWTPVSAHLTSTALHSNPAVAMYAVDSIRQLSIQYLQREELGVFEFQRRFLKPLEIVMARSEIHTTKELLLKCVERLILMFGTPVKGQDGRGQLRSGWGPILTVLGLAGKDADKDIATMGFTMLTSQLEPVLAQENTGNNEEQSIPGVLLAERFVDLVDALLIYVGGPHEEMSLKSIDHLLALTAYLADDSFALPLIRHRASSKTASFDDTDIEAKEVSDNKELELWWPILLGISRVLGDDRKAVRTRCLEVLLKIIMTHFFPSTKADQDEAKKARQIQILQLIFRGILTPVLELAEVDALDARPPPLPDDFDRFLTAPKKGEAPPKTQAYWLDTTFEQFMDACTNICLRTVEEFGEDALLEEYFAMLNSCLLSDSGALAVRGLRRLEQFLTSDLKASAISDDIWATVSHMLRRTLSVRGPPRGPASGASNGASATSKPSSEEAKLSETMDEEQQEEAIQEFAMEDSMLLDRRFIGGNAVFVMGSLLSGQRFEQTIGLRWRLFLVTGLGKAVRDWETAASILKKHGLKVKRRLYKGPTYLETAYYGRRYMNRFLLQIASLRDVESATTAEGSRQATAQTLLKEQTQALMSDFMEKEAALADESTRTPFDAELYERLASLVKDLLAGYDKLPEEQLAKMSWLESVLSPCVSTEKETVRTAIQKLIQPRQE